MLSSLNQLSNTELERYCRQAILPEILSKNQIKIINSKVIVIGAGGLGCTCLMYLAGSGVGCIGIVDGDNVEVSNLHRQVIHMTSNIGKNKASSAEEYINKFNPLVKTKVYQSFLSNKNAYEIVSNYDLIIDCTDNPGSRYLINDIAVLLNIPLVSGSAIRYQGQLTVYISNDTSNKVRSEEENIGCYRCLFPIPSPSNTVGACNEEGVFSPVPGTIGILQATEALKLIIGMKDSILSNRLLTYDAIEMKFRVYKLKGRRHECEVCGEKKVTKEYIEGFNYKDFTSQEACQSKKRVDLPIENQVNWKEILLNKEKLNETDNIFIDVRSKEQFDLYKLNEERIFLVNLPMEMLLIEDSSLIYDKYHDKTVYIYCRSGNKSTIAVDYLLNTCLLKRVYNLNGGYIEYMKMINEK